MRRLAGLALVAAAAAAVAPAAALAGPSARALRTSILAAARKERSVHYVVESSVGGSSVTIVGEAARTKGIQQIAFASGRRTGDATVLVVARKAYVRGDALALRAFIGLTKSQATRYAGRWVFVPRTNRMYASVAAAVTLPSFLAQIDPQTHLARVGGTLGRHRVVGVRGLARHDGVEFVEALYARAGAVPLPVGELEAAIGRDFRSRTAVGSWNSAVHVRAPAHAVRLGGGGSGGGGGLSA